MRSGLLRGAEDGRILDVSALGSIGVEAQAVALIVDAADHRCVRGQGARLRDGAGVRGPAAFALHAPHVLGVLGDHVWSQAIDRDQHHEVGERLRRCARARTPMPRLNSATTSRSHRRRCLPAERCSRRARGLVARPGQQPVRLGEQQCQQGDLSRAIPAPSGRAAACGQPRCRASRSTPCRFIIAGKGCSPQNPNAMERNSQRAV